MSVRGRQLSYGHIHYVDVRNKTEYQRGREEKVKQDRVRETQAEGEAGSSIQGVPCGTRFGRPRDHALSRRHMLNH